MRGANLLARVIEERVREMVRGPDVLELGTIQADGSLLLDRFPWPIPRGEYLVCRSLTLPDPVAETGPGGADGHTHPVRRPEGLAPLRPGDRVLVAWVNRGSDPVVIDVVVTS